MLQWKLLKSFWTAPALGLLTVIVNQSFPQHPESQTISGQWHELLPQEDNAVVPGLAMKQVPT